MPVSACLFGSRYRVQRFPAVVEMNGVLALKVFEKLMEIPVPASATASKETLSRGPSKD